MNMKTLQEYIDESEYAYYEDKLKSNKHFDDCYPLYKAYQDRKKLIEELWPDGDYPDEIILREESEIMHEMLQSHSVDKLIVKLKKSFPDNIHSIHRANGANDKGKRDGVIIVTNSDKLKDDDLFKNIIHYFNYFYTQTNTIEGQTYILLEPHFSDKVDVLSRNHGKAYHICSKENASNILKTGLKIKGSQDNKGNHYRYYPQRVYLILPLYSHKDYIRKKIEEALDVKRLKHDYGVLEVNIRDIHDSFYEDVTMPSKEDYVYTYQYIPPKYIKDMTHKFNNI